MLLRVLLSITGSGVLVGLASLGMLLTTAPRAVSLLLEPFSLLFLPGIALAIGWTVTEGHLEKHTKSFADSHDFPVSFVLLCTLAFYFLVLYWLLHRRRGPALTARGTSA